MSVKQRVKDIAYEVAMEVGQQLAEIRIKQITASVSALAQVTKVDGNQVTMSMSDGTTKTVTNAGSRIVGKGDFMVTDGQTVAF